MKTNPRKRPATQATMDADDQKMYTDTLENLTCATREIPKGGSEA